MTFHSDSVEQTEAIASELAARLRGGECIALSGEMGVGKTQFVRGLVRGLGGSSRSVSSPTYVLLNVYPGGRLTTFHLDAHRVSGADDFDAIGFPELLEQGGVVVVEWPQRVAPLLPNRHISVHISAIASMQRIVDVVHANEEHNL